MHKSRLYIYLSFVCALASLTGCLSAVARPSGSGGPLLANSDNAYYSPFGLAVSGNLDIVGRSFNLTAEESSYLDGMRGRPVEIAYSYDLASTEITGRPAGMLTPIVDVLENEFGLEVNLRKLNWEEAFLQVESGEVDYYGPVAISEARRQKYVTAGPFYRSHTEIVSRVADPISSMSGLYNSRIGLLNGSIISRTMKTYLGANGEIVYFPTMDDMIDGLRSGIIDAFATVDNAELEILPYPDIQYDFSVENFYADQGFISSSEEMRPLSALINRYLSENPGIINEIIDERVETIYQSERIRLSDEIAYLRENYDEVTIYADAFLYPLCYEQNGTINGMQVEINDIFERLTGVPVRIATKKDFKGGVYSALEKLEMGECMAVAGAYYSMDMWEDPGKLYSRPIWSCMLRTYARRDMGDQLLGKSVGTTVFISDYVGWDIVTGSNPVIYDSHDGLLSAMKSDDIDAVFMGETAFNYCYTVLGDYSLREVSGISAKANVHMLYDIENTQFNTLYDEAVALLQALDPKSKGRWEFQTDRYKADYIRMRYTQQIYGAVVIAIFMILMAALYLLLRSSRKAFRITEEKNRTIIDGMTYARRVQKNLLPPAEYFEKAFSDYSVIWKPRDIVGGDIYWLKNFSRGAVLCVCDCTGHGTSGALLTMLVVSSLEEIVNESNCDDTAQIMFRLDGRISSALGSSATGTEKSTGDILDLNDGCDLAVLFIGKDGAVVISAGNTHVFICDGSEVRRIKGQKLHVGEGSLRGPDDVRVINVPATPKNKFYIASDGLYDQIGGEHSRPFGYRTVRDIILENHGESQDVISNMIWNSFEAYRGGQARRDDAQLITFKP